MKINIDKSNIKGTNLIIEEQEILESIVLKNNITAHARLMYIYLLKTFDSITIDNLAKKFNKTTYNIIVYFKELENSDLIELFKTKNKELIINLKIPHELVEEAKKIDEQMKDIEKFYEF